MGARILKSLHAPAVQGIAPADLVRLCPGCDTPLDDHAESATFSIQGCPHCGLSLMTPRARGLRRW
jgi:hypothetical protein